MKVISLLPSNDVYQVVDENDNVLYQGGQIECMAYVTFKTKEK